MAAFLRVLISRWFLTLVLVLGLSALIWLFGPRLSFDEARPFASEGVRLVVIVVLLVLWGIFARLDARPRAAATEPAKPAAAASADAVTRGPNPEEKRAITRELDLMRRDFALGFRRLRRSAPGLGLGGSWRYQLPWYLVLGGPGAGKTALLEGSGLSFGEAPGAGDGPRESIWAERIALWFADEAVFLEPPGDLVADAEAQTVAGAVWDGMLQILRQNRPRQPLNGIVLSVALPELLRADEAALRDSAAHFRNRLREIRVRTGQQVPVYLVLTQADRLAGFAEFFDELPVGERGQVLGITFPAPGATVAPLAALEPEFDALLDSLNRRVMERLHREPDIARRGQSFAFPQQLALARGPLRVFMETLFRASRFEEAPIARGVWLTSAEQGGAVVDLMRSALGVLVPATPVAAPASRRRAWFIADLVRNVILPEAHAVGLDPRFERRRRTRAAVLVGVVAAFALGLALAWHANLSDSNRMLDQHSRTVAWANQLTGALMQSADDNGIIHSPGLDTVVRPLGELRTTRDELAQSVSERPWRSYLGHYHGAEVVRVSATAYDAALLAQFLPRVLLHLEQRLTDRDLTGDRLHALLGAYLILGGEGPLQRDLLHQTLDREFTESLPGRENLAVREALAQHLRALPLPPPDNRAPVFDPAIVDFARERLAETSRGERGMTLLRALREIQRLPGLRLTEIGGPLTQQVLERRSGLSLQQSIPGVFTVRGFRRGGKPAVDRVSLMLAREGWVMGAATDPATIAHETLDIRDEILQVYAEQYIRQWEEILADLAVQRPASVEEAANRLSILGGAASPLRRIYVTAAAETYLLAAQPEPAEEAGGAQALSAAAGALAARGPALAREAASVSALALSSGLPGAADDQMVEQMVSDRFASLREMTGEAGDGAALTALIDQLGEAATVFTQLIHGPDQEGAFLALLDGSASGGVPVAAGLARAGSSLPAPLGAMLGVLSNDIRAVGARGAQDVIAASWASSVSPVCTAVTSGRFPVDPTGVDAISVEDFAGLFGPGGVLDSFFTERLEPLVDTRRSPWRWHEGRGGDTGFAPDTPTWFERVHTMRRALFPNGAAVPTVRFQLRPRTLDAAADRVTLELGDARLQYAHGVREAQSFEWIAADDSMVRVFLTPPLPGQPDGLTQTGPWSLFTFLRAASLAPTEQPDRFDLRVELGNRTVSFELQGSSIGNPFGNGLFDGLTCPEVL